MCRLVLPQLAGLPQRLSSALVRLHPTAARGVHGRKVGSATTTLWPKLPDINSVHLRRRRKWGTASSSTHPGGFAQRTVPIGREFRGSKVPTCWNSGPQRGTRAPTPLDISSVDSKRRSRPGARAGVARHEPVRQVDRFEETAPDTSPRVGSPLTSPAELSRQPTRWEAPLRRDAAETCLTSRPVEEATQQVDRVDVRELSPFRQRATHHSRWTSQAKCKLGTCLRAARQSAHLCVYTSPDTFPIWRHSGDAEQPESTGAGNR